MSNTDDYRAAVREAIDAENAEALRKAEERVDLLAALAQANANIQKAKALGLRTMAQDIRRERRRIIEKLEALDA